MSLHYWNTLKDRSDLRSLYTATCVLYMFDHSNDNPSDSESEDEEEEHSKVKLTLLFTLATLVKHGQVHGPVEDKTIVFGRRIVINDLNESQCIMHFRFRKQHLKVISQELWNRLELKGNYTNIECHNRYRCPFETALLILLYRFSRPRRYRPEMEEFFGMRKSHLSVVVDAMVDSIYDLALPYFTNPIIFGYKMPYYAEKIYQKCGLLNNLWGFIDGTLRKTARPLYYQKQAYSGHKRCHGLKFQTVVTPDGLIACLWGPMNGNRHDSHMLRESCLLQQLQDCMPINGQTYSLYGDPAYPQSIFIFGGFWHPFPGSMEAIWNRLMSKVREVVEWGYNQIIMNWKYLDFKQSMKIFEVPVSKYFIVGAFLTNIRTTFYNNQINEYFDCKTMSFHEYLNLVN